MNRAQVRIDKQFPVIRVTGVAAVYDLDDGSRHVDVASLEMNGDPVEFAEGLPKVQQQVRDLFIAQAEAEEQDDGEN